MQEKKPRITGKYIQLNLENLNKLPVHASVRSFLQEYLKPEKTMEAQTSGSTGTPKIMRVQKEYMQASARKTLEFLNIEKSGRTLLCLSADHIAGMMMLVRWIEGELDLWTSRPSARPLEEFSGKFEFAAMVPYQVFHSLDQLHRVQKLIIGGGAIPADLESRLTGRNTEIYHTYGMTETLSHVAMRQISPQLEDKFVAMPRCRFGQDSRSCLVINAPDIGVHGLVTKDVVELIDERSFRWLGRLDNVVNSGSVKLHPERIEKKIGNIGRSYFLAGVQDEALGQKLLMLIEGERRMDDSLLSQVMNRLNQYEKPREVRYVKEFQRTPTGKIRRQSILDKLE